MEINDFYAYFKAKFRCDRKNGSTTFWNWKMYKMKRWENLYFFAMQILFKDFWATLYMYYAWSIQNSTHAHSTAALLYYTIEIIYNASKSSCELLIFYSLPRIFSFMAQYSCYRCRAMVFAQEGRANAHTKTLPTYWLSNKNPFNTI